MPSDSPRQEPQDDFWRDEDAFGPTSSRASTDGFARQRSRASSDLSNTTSRSRRRKLALRTGLEINLVEELHNEALQEQEQEELPPEVSSDATVTGVEPDSLEPMLRHNSASSASPSHDFDGVEDDDLDDEPPADDPPDNSPYPQVRASVAATDDITLSISTPRMWTLALVFASLGSATNLFFSLRYPSVTITPVLALLLSHPLGLLWDQTLKSWDDPHETFVNGHLEGRTPRASSAAEPPLMNTNPDTLETPTAHESWRRRLRLFLAQGRWNEKEHACVFISSNVSFGFAFATDVIVEQLKFYQTNVTPLYQLLLILSTQVLGYAVAGMTRRYLVRPAGMIWPSTLMSTTMFRTLHKDENRPANGWRISRWRFFVLVFFGSFAFYFLPGLLIPTLSYFNVLTWFAPDNVVVANLFGVSSGLGLFPVTFDWTQIAYTGSPLVVPFWAALNVIGGLVAVMWLIAPLLYYTNTFFSSYMPILSSSVFDNTGRPYNVQQILTPDFLFDEDAYHRYSRVFLPITYLLSYAVQFASITALISHTACWHGKDIWRQWRRSMSEERVEPAKYEPLSTQSDSVTSLNKGQIPTQPSSTSRLVQPALDQLMGAQDVHNRLMARYEDVPILWYLLTGAVTIAVGIFVVEYYPVYLPWYGLVLAIGIAIVLFIPIGIVMAITNQQSSIYLICQLICGSLFPGRPVANMVFVTYGYITSTQGMKFSSDLKLGQYMKIPPKTLFLVQMIATITSSLIQFGVLNWMLLFINGLCQPNAINGLTCPLARVHFNGSILWGVVGPARFFGRNELYHPLVWAFAIGAVAPIIIWAIAKQRPHEPLWRKINLPVVFGSLSWIPPATGLNFSVWALVCFAFNHVIRRRKEAWWRKYTMTLSAALDAGVAFGIGVVFFGLVYTGLMDGFSWWGTEIYKQGCDWEACSLKTVQPGERFGPNKW